MSESIDVISPEEDVKSPEYERDPAPSVPTFSSEIRLLGECTRLFFDTKKTNTSLVSKFELFLADLLIRAVWNRTEINDDQTKPKLMKLLTETVIQLCLQSKLSPFLDSKFSDSLPNPHQLTVDELALFLQNLREAGYPVDIRSLLISLRGTDFSIVPESFQVAPIIMLNGGGKASGGSFRPGSVDLLASHLNRREQYLRPLAALL